LDGFAFSIRENNYERELFQVLFQELSDFHSLSINKECIPEGIEFYR
jgi:hypothetical protein